MFRNFGINYKSAGSYAGKFFAQKIDQSRSGLSTSYAPDIPSPSIDPATLGAGLTVYLNENGQSTNGGNSTWVNQGSLTNLSFVESAGGFNAMIGEYSAFQFVNSTAFGLAPNWTGMPSELFSLNSYHIFVVAEIYSVDTNSANNWSNDCIMAHDNARFGFFNFKSTDIMYSFHQNQGGSYGGVALTSSNTVQYLTPVLLETWYDGTDLKIKYADGETQSAPRGNIEAGTNTYSIYIGRNSGGGAVMSGALATLLVVTSSLDDSTREGVRRYLGTKYGVAY